MPPLDPAFQKFLDTEYAAGRRMRPIEALAAMRSNLRNFLTHYPIQNNFDCATSGITTAYLSNDTTPGSRPGEYLGTKRMHEAQMFRLQNAPTHAAAANLTVYGVHMGQSSAGPMWFQLPSSGPDIMLTAKLTGCTFVARQAGNVVEVAHLQPHQEDGIQLHTRMNTIANAYGRLRYDLDSRSINVIGVRRGTQWEIYAQKLEKSTNSIRSVTKVFPA